MKPLEYRFVRVCPGECPEGSLTCDEGETLRILERSINRLAANGWQVSKMDLAVYTVLMEREKNNSGAP